MGLGNNPDNNRPNDGRNNDEKGQGHDKGSADSSQGSGFDGVTLPDFGKKIGEGHYVLSVDGGVVSAGTADVHEEGLLGSEVLDLSDLKMLGVHDKDAALRALKGDGGSARTSVGYSAGYSSKWDTISWDDASNN